MNKKLVVVLSAILLALGIAAAFAYFTYFSSSINKNTSETLSPIAKDKKVKENVFEALTEPLKKKKSDAFEEGKNLNVLLLGIDRRSKAEQSFNTDTMILVTVNPETNKVLLTSVPRDLWINGNKMNALYSVFGPETLLDAFEKITGQEIDGYIRADFEDIVWIVDSMGGVPVNVERTFTDNSFPNNTDTDIVSVTFNEGTELMTGERALTFSRSRKGNNGEGSDLMRAKRQHLILQSMIEGISQPDSIFWPMDVEAFYKAVTLPTRMYTTLTLDDAFYLWDFYDDRDKYEITSFVVDDVYVYHPGMYPESEYHAWVFIPKEEGFEQLHSDIKQMLGEEIPTTETPDATNGETPTITSEN